MILDGKIITTKVFDIHIFKRLLEYMVEIGGLPYERLPVACLVWGGR